MNMQEWWFSEKAQIAIAGAAGGVVRWLTLREDWKDGLISIVVGAICSLYLSPLALPVLEPTLGKIITNQDQVAGFSGFVIGIGGIAVAGSVLDVWKARRKSAGKS